MTIAMVPETKDREDLGYLLNLFGKGKTIVLDGEEHKILGVVSGRCITMKVEDSDKEAAPMFTTPSDFALEQLAEQKSDTVVESRTRRATR